MGSQIFFEESDPQEEHHGIGTTKRVIDDRTVAGLYHGGNRIRV
jgi:hypothetical protein